MIRGRVSANWMKRWCRGTELNRRRQPFQGCALPPELPRHRAIILEWICSDVKKRGAAAERKRCDTSQRVTGSKPACVTDQELCSNRRGGSFHKIAPAA